MLSSMVPDFYAGFWSVVRGIGLCGTGTVTNWLLQVYVPQKAWYLKTYMDTNSSIDFEKLHQEIN